mgnify:CR=1 FL=1
MVDPGGGDAIVDRGVGDVDYLQRLWTPHRMVYIDGENKPATTGECPFCVAPTRTDRKSVV